MTLLLDSRFVTAAVPNVWTYVDSTDIEGGNGTSMTFPPGSSGGTDPDNNNQLSFVSTPRRRDTGFSVKMRIGGDPAAERLEFLRTGASFLTNADGVEHWMSFSIYVEEFVGNPKITVLQLFSQYHATRCGTGNGANDLYLAHPTLTPGNTSDRWNYRIMGGLNACSRLAIDNIGAPVVEGEWIDFLIHYKWSHAADGLTELWHRRPALTDTWTQAFSHQRANLVCGSSTAHGALTVRHGCYSSKNVATPTVLYLSGLVVATTRTEAEEASFGEAEDPGGGGGGGGSGGPITLVKQATAATAAAGTSLTVTVPAGGFALDNRLVVMAAPSGGFILNSVTDSRSNSYTVHRNRTLTTSVTCAVASCLITTALVAGDTITLNYSGSAHSAAVVAEYSGLGAVDQVGAGVTFSSDSTPPGDSITNTVDGDLVLGVFAGSGNPAINTPTSGYTNQTGSASTGTIRTIDWQSKVAVTAGAEDTTPVSMTGSATGAWVAVSFQPTTGPIEFTVNPAQDFGRAQSITLVPPLETLVDPAFEDEIAQPVTLALSEPPPEPSESPESEQPTSRVIVSTPSARLETAVRSSHRIAVAAEVFTSD